jgi:hypothetical protein
MDMVMDIASPSRGVGNAAMTRSGAGTMESRPAAAGET